MKLSPCIVRLSPCLMRLSPCLMRPSPCLMRPSPCLMRPSPCVDRLASSLSLTSRLDAQRDPQEVRDSRGQGSLADRPLGRQRSALHLELERQWEPGLDALAVFDGRRELRAARGADGGVVETESIITAE